VNQAYVVATQHLEEMQEMCRLAADFVATAYGGAHGILWSTQMHVDQDHTGEPNQGCGEEDLPTSHEAQSTEVLCHQSSDR